jgi:hypothetical protein
MSNSTESALAVGLRHCERLMVGPNHTVPQVDPNGPGFRDVPPVLATAMMIGFVEQTRIAALRPFMSPDQRTVGTHVDISHVAPTPTGMVVTTEIGAPYFGCATSAMCHRTPVRSDKYSTRTPQGCIAALGPCRGLSPAAKLSGHHPSASRSGRHGRSRPLLAPDTPQRRGSPSMRPAEPPARSRDVFHQPPGGLVFESVARAGRSRSRSTPRQPAIAK